MTRRKGEGLVIGPDEVEEDVRQVLNQRLEVILVSEPMGCDAATLLAIYFSSKVVNRELGRLSEGERIGMIRSQASGLLHRRGEQRMASTFSRVVAENRVQSIYETENPADALMERIINEVKGLIAGGFFDPLEELLPDGFDID